MWEPLLFVLCVIACLRARVRVLCVGACVCGAIEHQIREHQKLTEMYQERSQQRLSIMPPNSEWRGAGHVRDPAYPKGHQRANNDETHLGQSTHPAVAQGGGGGQAMFR